MPNLKTLNEKIEHLENRLLKLEKLLGNRPVPHRPGFQSKASMSDLDFYERVNRCELKHEILDDALEKIAVTLISICTAFDQTDGTV